MWYLVFFRCAEWMQITGLCIIVNVQSKLNGLRISNDRHAINIIVYNVTNAIVIELIIAYL